MRFFNQRVLWCDDIALVCPEWSQIQDQDSPQTNPLAALGKAEQQERVISFVDVRRSAFALYVDEPLPASLVEFARKDQPPRTMRIEPPIYLGPAEMETSEEEELRDEFEAFDIPAGQYVVEASHIRIPAGFERKTILGRAGLLGSCLLLMWKAWVFSLAIGVLAMTMALTKFSLMVGIAVTCVVMLGLAVTFLGRRTKAYQTAWETQMAFDQEFPELVVVLKSTKG
ncbi:hypothetical protein AB1L30_11190 [Bremerella sp. JC817]|uniref:hypothetical protein n=1 Tax=Bremerella sp. JC817 TaxID=3231756 RepID=UPI00345B1751